MTRAVPEAPNHEENHVGSCPDLWHGADYRTINLTQVGTAGSSHCVAGRIRGFPSVAGTLFRPRNTLSRRDIAPGSPGLRGPIARRCGRDRAPGPRSQSFLCQAGMSYVAHFTRHRRPFGGPQAAPFTLSASPVCKWLTGAGRPGPVCPEHKVKAPAILSNYASLPLFTTRDATGMTLSSRRFLFSFSFLLFSFLGWLLRSDSLGLWGAAQLQASALPGLDEPPQHL